MKLKNLINSIGVTTVILVHQKIHLPTVILLTTATQMVGTTVAIIIQIMEPR